MIAPLNRKVVSALSTVNFSAVSSVSISQWNQGHGGHLLHQRILVTRYQYRSFHLDLSLVLEREFLLLQVVFKIEI